MDRCIGRISATFVKHFWKLPAKLSRKISVPILNFTAGALLFDTSNWTPTIHKALTTQSDIVLQSMSGTYKQQCESSSQALTLILARLPSPCTVSSWILEADWRLPVCNTLPFLSEIALRRFPDKTATQKGHVHGLTHTVAYHAFWEQLFLYLVHRVVSHL